MFACYLKNASARRITLATSSTPPTFHNRTVFVTKPDNRSILKTGTSFTINKLTFWYK